MYMYTYMHASIGCTTLLVRIIANQTFVVQKKNTFQTHVCIVTLQGTTLYNLEKNIIHLDKNK